MLRWLFWGIYFVAWTIALILPGSNFTGLGLEDLPVGGKFLLAKSLHVLAYTILTILSGWLMVPVRYRWILVFVLLTHGTLTEMIQTIVPNRTGKLEDVAIDNLGVLLGIVITWRWWCKPD